MDILFSLLLFEFSRQCPARSDLLSEVSRGFISLPDSLEIPRKEMVVYNRTIMSREVLGERVVCEEERERRKTITRDTRDPRTTKPHEKTTTTTTRHTHHHRHTTTHDRGLMAAESFNDRGISTKMSQSCFCKTINDRTQLGTNVRHAARSYDVRVVYVVAASSSSSSSRPSFSFFFLSCTSSLPYHLPR